MIGIKKIAVYIPEGRIDNVEQAARFAEPREFIETKIGALKLSRKDQGEETSDLAARALEKLIDSADLKKSDIEALVVVTQNGDGQGLPHTSAIVQQKCGLPTTVAAFDISLGCSGYVYGLSILLGLMHAAGFKNAVLITADPYSKVIDGEDRVTTLLFGDAATATWLGEHAEWGVRTPLFGTDGSGAVHLEVKDDKLSMNGRQVFNFAALKIPEHIKTYLSKYGMEETDVDSFCLHQGSAAIIDAISRRFPNVKDRFVCEMSDTGNTVSSTIPILLEKRLEDTAYNRILISGFGVGLSWATTIIDRKV